MSNTQKLRQTIPLSSGRMQQGSLIIIVMLLTGMLLTILSGCSKADTSEDSQEFVAEMVEASAAPVLEAANEAAAYVSPDV